MGLSFRNSPLAQFRKSFWRYFSFSSKPRSARPLSFLRNPRGSALIMAFIFMVIASLLVVAGAQLVKVVNQQSRQQEFYANEAKNAAIAGLLDAEGYFTRTSTLSNQPVAAAQTFGLDPNPMPTYNGCSYCTPGPTYSYVDQAFHPLYNCANPVTGDTMDQTDTSITNEFSPMGAGSVSQYVNETIWDHYVVLTQQNPFPTPSTAPTYTPNPMAVHDISGERVSNTWNGSGLEWYLVSTGYVYKRNDFRKSTNSCSVAGTDWLIPYNQYPNVVLAKAEMATEIRKLTVQTPFNGMQAAVYMDRSGSLTIGQDVDDVVDGRKGTASGCAGVSTFSSCASPKGANSTNFPQTVTCAPTTAANQLTDLDVFGMPVTQIAAIADIVGDNSSTNPQTLVFGTVPQLAYYNGDLTIDPSSSVTSYQQLDATGILVVNGNLTLNSAGTTVQTYFGVIFVTKNFTMNGGYVDGEVIVGYTGPSSSSAGNVTIINSADGLTPGTLIYDHDLVTPGFSSSIIPKVAKYREDMSQRRLLLPIPQL